MALVYLPLPPEDERAPAYVEQYMAEGVDIEALCVRMGWLSSCPKDVPVYDTKGSLISEPEAPESPPAPTAKPKGK